MKRIAFVLAGQNTEWIGGLNYLRNLLRAIASVPERKIEPVLVVSPAASPAFLAEFPPLEILRTPLADPGRTGWQLARKLPQRLLGRDLLMERFLRRHRIDALSHSGLLGGAATLPTVGWIPDFQHRRMPQFFSAAEISALNEACRRIANQSAVVLLSSRDAQGDFDEQYPHAVGKGRLLNFVACPDSGEPAADEQTSLRQRYELRQPFFHIPNQFWAHKNHRIVLEALAILKKQGRPALVVSTGNTKDRRQPEHFTELMRLAESIGVDDQFRVLGLVPYADVPALMRHSLAVINPSYFEGWSTSVEESKSLGLNVILSDIAVHREQAPERGRFFNPDSATELAMTMTSVVAAHSLTNEVEQRRLARQRLPQRLHAFGEAYQAIVLEVA